MNSDAILYCLKTTNYIEAKPMFKANYMKTKFPISFLALAVPENSSTTVANGPVSYIIGGIIALLIMGYLVYTLLHPDKF